VNTHNEHNSLLISRPQTSQPHIRSSLEFLKRLRRLANNNECCEEVYAETVRKHKGGTVETFRDFEFSMRCIGPRKRPNEAGSRSRRRAGTAPNRRAF